MRSVFMMLICEVKTMRKMGLNFCALHRKPKILSLDDFRISHDGSQKMLEIMSTLNMSVNTIYWLFVVNLEIFWLHCAPNSISLLAGIKNHLIVLQLVFGTFITDNLTTTIKGGKILVYISFLLHQQSIFTNNRDPKE